MRGVYVMGMLVFVHEIPDFFVLNAMHPPNYTNAPLPSIKTFLTSSTRTSTCTSSNIVTSTTRPTTSRGTNQAADASIIRRLLEYDSDESEIDISRD